MGRLRKSEASKELVRAYKQYLREILEKRPYVTQAKVAAALGMSVSNASHVLNPKSDRPISEKYAPGVIEAFKLTWREKAHFISLYLLAHRDRTETFANPTERPRTHRHILVRVHISESEALNDLIDQTVQKLATDVSGSIIEGTGAKLPDPEDYEAND